MRVCDLKGKRARGKVIYYKLVYISVDGENSGISKGVVGAERSFLATTENGFCKSYEIALAMF